MGNSLREFIESVINLLEASARRLIEITSHVCEGALTRLMIRCFIGAVVSALVVIGFIWLLFR